MQMRIFRRVHMKKTLSLILSVLIAISAIDAVPFVSSALTGNDLNQDVSLSSKMTAKSSNSAKAVNRAELFLDEDDPEIGQLINGGNIASGEEKTVEINEEGTIYQYYFISEETGTYYFYSEGEYDTYGYLLDSEGEGLNFNDDGEYDLNFCFSYYCEAGETYILLVRFYSQSETGSFNIKASTTEPYTNLRPDTILFKPSRNYTLIENADGEWEYDDNDEKFFYYYIPDFKNGDELTVNYEDGASKTYTYRADYRYDGEWLDEDDNLIDVRPSKYSYQYSNPWTLGGDNYFTVEYMGASVEVPVTIIENPVESISFKPLSEYTLFENANGEWEYDDNDENFFKYDAPYFKNGDELTVNYKDGTSKTYTYSEDDDLWLDEDGKVIDGWPDTNSYQYSNHWALGSDNYITVEYMNASVEVPVTIIENPIDYIEVSTEAKLIENNGGYLSWDEYYDEEEDEWLEGNYYYYDLEGLPINIDIYYTDSTSETITSNTYSGYNGYDIWIDTNQSFDNQWSPNNPNMEFTVTYLGKTASAKIEMIANPIVDFDIIQREDNFELSEDGKIDVGYLGELFDFDVRFADGASKKYTAENSYLMDMGGYFDDNEIYHKKNAIYSDYVFEFEATAKPNSDKRNLTDGDIVTIEINGIQKTTELKFGQSVDREVLLAVNDFMKTLDENDYSSESFEEIKNAIGKIDEAVSADDWKEYCLTQKATDAEISRILELINNLVPYLNFSVSSENGTVESSANETSILSGTEITLKASADDGYVFKGWYEKDSKRIFSTDEEYTFVLTSNTDLMALFVPENANSLIFTNATGQIVDMISKTVNEWRLVSSLNGLLPRVPYSYGYTNGAWDIPDDTLAKLQSGENIVIIPAYDELEDVYIPEAPIAEDIPALSMYYTYDETNSVGSFVMAVDIPDGCRVESIGTAFYYKEASQFDPSEFILTVNNKALTSKFDDLEEGVYVTNINKFTSEYNWSARGYVTYYDSEGNLKVSYSNQINIVDIQQIV